MTEGPTRGPIALVGAGEFLPTMAEVDRWLLALAVPGGQHVPRVAIVPTAAAADGPETFARWGEMGTAHFRTLGAEAMVAQIQTPADARYPARVAALADQDLYYFSGGVPELLIEIFRDSPAWDAILAAHNRGAELAGCSAGAMAFGPATIAVREMVRGGVPGWIPALGLIPRVCTLPHFDRMHEFVDDQTFICAHIDELRWVLHYELHEIHEAGASRDKHGLALLRHQSDRIRDVSRNCVLEITHDHTLLD